MSEGEFKCDFILARMKKMLEIEEECKSFGRNNILPENILADTSPYFYPFIIEFSLIGASVFYIMSNHVGKRTSRLKLRQPNPLLAVIFTWCYVLGRKYKMSLADRIPKWRIKDCVHFSEWVYCWNWKTCARQPIAIASCKFSADQFKPS